MTERIYEIDDRTAAFSATVLACRPEGDSYAVLLDRTAFYPAGGGQGGDRGTLNGIPVSDVREEGEDLWHLTTAPFPPGTLVDGQVDMAVRRDRTQNHTGEHIVSGILHRLYGFHNVGFHLGDDDATMDFDGVIDRAALDRVEDEANRAVWENRPVTVSYPSPAELSAIDYRAKGPIAGRVRLVTVEGYDVCACCAPHVHFTGEIGLIKLLDFIHYKGGIRIHFACGGRALRILRDRYAQAAAISRACAVPQEECAAAVERLLAEQKKQKEAAVAAAGELAALRAAALVPDANGVICHFEEVLDAEADLRRLALAAAARADVRVCAVFRGHAKEGYRFTVAARSLPLRALAADMRAALAARGGGSDELISGRTAAARGDILSFFTAWPTGK